MMSSRISPFEGSSSPEPYCRPVAIKQLPPELMAHILFFVYSSSRTYPWEVARLILVCRNWKNIIETSPQLWTNLDAQCGVKHLEYAVLKSGNLPVSVRYADRPPRMAFDDYLAIVSRAAARWGSIELRVPSLPSSFSALESSAYSSVETLIIDCIDGNFQSWLQDRLPLIQLFGGGLAPLGLKELELRGVNISLPAMQLSSLSSLTLVAVPNLRMEDLLSALTSCSMLARLHLEDLKGLYVPSRVPDPLIEVVNLRNYYYNLPKQVTRFLLDVLQTPSAVSACVDVAPHVLNVGRDRGLSNLLTPPVRGLSLFLGKLVSTLIVVNVDRTGKHSIQCDGLVISLPIASRLGKGLLGGSADRRLFWLQESVLTSLIHLLDTQGKFYRVHLRLTDADIDGEDLKYFDEQSTVHMLSLLKGYSNDGYDQVLKTLPDKALFPALETLHYDMRLGGTDRFVEVLQERYQESSRVRHEGPELLSLREVHFCRVEGFEGSGSDKFIERVRKATRGAEIYWEGVLVPESVAPTEGRS